MKSKSISCDFRCSIFYNTDINKESHMNNYHDKNIMHVKCVTLRVRAIEKMLENNIEGIVFDRNGYLYHGRVKALADGVRKAGVKF